MVDHGQTRYACTSQHLVIFHSNPYSFNSGFRIIQKVYDKYSKVRSADLSGESGIDEGSYIPNIKDIKNCLRSLKKIVEENVDDDEDNVSVGVNLCASKFYNHDMKTYRFNLSEENTESSGVISVEALDQAMLSLWREFNFAALEDMFHMDHREYYVGIMQYIFEQFVITEYSCSTEDEMLDPDVRGTDFNCFHLKVGEIGSVTMAIRLAMIAKLLKWKVILSSHDRCETSDPFLADLCVGLRLNLIKIGVSCITGACNICNRIRELEVEIAEENWRRCPTPHIRHHTQKICATIRGEAPPKHCACKDADWLENEKKKQFKMMRLHGY